LSLVILLGLRLTGRGSKNVSPNIKFFKRRLINLDSIVNKELDFICISKMGGDKCFRNWTWIEK